MPAGSCCRLNGDDDLKTLKWISIGVVLALLLSVAINGSLADNNADNVYLTIVQSELERNGSGLQAVRDDRYLSPVAHATLTNEPVLLKDTFSVTDKNNNAVSVALSVEEKLYTDKNALDHIVVVTNTGNTGGYIRTWFAFEMGELSGEEFEKAIKLNRNSSKWTWGEFQFAVKIDGQNYAVVCAEYNEELKAGQTTDPGLLQILMDSDVSGEILGRIDGNHDGLYKVLAHSQVVSDSAAWSQVNCPWIKGDEQSAQ